MNSKAHHYEKLSDVPESVWEKLANKKIFFAHQSVGNNILEGINELMKDYPELKFDIIKTTDFENIKGGALAHAEVGKNTDPKSKIEAFSNFIRNGIGKEADIVALKFCYVDITEGSDPNIIFTDYKNEVDRLKEAYPNLIVVHFTSPLTRLQSGWKAAIKKIMGKPLGGMEENMKRAEYNELLLKEYQGKDPIFDIAKFESTDYEGKRCSFDANNKTYYSLFPEYTNDGGHLNETGRKKVAEQFLLLLASII